MKVDEKAPDYIILSKEDLDKAVDTILNQTQSEDSYEKINKTIHDAFYNKMFLAKNGRGWSNFKVYRVTPIYEGFDPKKPECFSYNKNPGLGRANRAGFPVFYCSLNHVTALREMKDDLPYDTTYYVSQWEINFTQDIFIQLLLYNSITTDTGFFMNQAVKDQVESLFLDGVFKSLSEEEKENMKYLFLKLGDLFTIRSEPSDSYYHITSAYAHSMLYDMKEKNM